MNVHTRVTKTKNLAIYNTTFIPQIDMATFFMEEPKYKPSRLQLEDADFEAPCFG